MKLPRDVQASIARQLPKEVKKPFRREIDRKFNKIKKEMIKDFLSHPITQELKQGPKGSNISGTLGGTTNLFAFIGFDNGYDPISPILNALQETKIIKDSPETNGKSVRRYTIDMPTAKDIFSITPMPWAVGRSWAKGIESGISGLGYLLSKSSKISRSGVAIQGNKKVRSAKFKNVKYISDLINRYKNRFDKLK